MDKRNELCIELETLCFRLGNANEAIALWRDFVEEELGYAAGSKELAACTAARLHDSYLPVFEVVAESLRSIHGTLQAMLYEPAE